MSDEFKIAETENFHRRLKKITDQHLKDKISNFVYFQLRNNPFYGPNIKKLKGEYSGIYRYRISDYRIFYTIDTNQKLVFIIDIELRKNLY